MAKKIFNHYKGIPELPDEFHKKKARPKVMAVVDEDNCTGCEACIPFCPVDCIEPVPKEKYNIPIPPVQVRFNECIGCKVCARVCTKLTWDAIRLMDTDIFEKVYGVEIESI